MTERKTGEFVARDSNNNDFTIQIWTTMVQMDTLSDGADESPGTKRLATSSGKSVRRIDKGKYQILGGAEPIDVISDEPSAV